VYPSRSVPDESEHFSSKNRGYSDGLQNPKWLFFKKDFNVFD
jgi:hypothetical protein